MFGSRHEAGRIGMWAVVLLGTLGYGGGPLPTAAALQRPPGPVPATAVVSAALKTATADRKVVLIEFGASWCTWCRQFEAFVRAPEVSSIVAANYVVVNLVVQEREDKKALENPGGQDVMEKWGGAKSGLPFYVFLDAAGRKIADSNAMPDGGNVGFPGTAKEVEIFLGLLDKTAPRLGTRDRTKIASYLETTIKP
jgi:thiol-disulfide isomerase/thioredoxin